MRYSLTVRENHQGALQWPKAVLTRKKHKTHRREHQIQVQVLLVGQIGYRSDPGKARTNE